MASLTAILYTKTIAERGHPGFSQYFAEDKISQECFFGSVYKFVAFIEVDGAGSLIP